MMITPFTEDNRIDYSGVERIIEWYDRNGVTGIFAVCQSSEMFFLDRSERHELAKFVIDHAPKHIQVVVSGHVEPDPEEQVREANTILELGADAYVFITNQLARQDEGDDTARKSVEYLLRNVPSGSLGLYECPYPYKRILSPSFLEWCADTGRFAFLKDTCCDLGQIQAKLEATKGSNLSIFNANAATLLGSLRMGCAGYSGVMANFHPDLYVWLCTHFMDEPQRAETMQDFCGASSMVECQIYPVNAKYHMALCGIPITMASRVRSASEMTSSRKLEIDQFKAITDHFRSGFLGQCR